MSEKEAEEAAAKKIKTQKIIAGVAGVSLASVAAYVAYNKYADEFIDKTLKSGTKFQTIDRGLVSSAGKAYARKLKGRDGRYYASYGFRDKIIYKGLYGKHLFSDLRTQSIVSIESSNTKDFKIPSRSKAASIFSDLYKNDSAFRSAVQTVANASQMQYEKDGARKQTLNMFRKGTRSMFDESGKNLTSNGYDLFNALLTSKYEPFQKDAAEKFYTKLKEAGYNAIVDMNDKKYSGYKTRNPLIIFDMDNVVQNQIREIGVQELNNAFVQQDLIRNSNQYLATIGIASGAYTLSKKAKNKNTISTPQKTKGG